MEPQIYRNYVAFLGSTTSMIAVSTVQNGTDCLNGSDRPHADRRQTSDPIHRRRQDYNFIISGKPKGGTYQFRLDYEAFLGSTRMPFAGNDLSVI